jgi:hypothetical protein
VENFVGRIRLYRIRSDTGAAVQSTRPSTDRKFAPCRRRRAECIFDDDFRSSRSLSSRSLLSESRAALASERATRARRRQRHLAARIAMHSPISPPTRAEALRSAEAPLADTEQSDFRNTCAFVLHGARTTRERLSLPRRRRQKQCIFSLRFVCTDHDTFDCQVSNKHRL